MAAVASCRAPLRLRAHRSAAAHRAAAGANRPVAPPRAFGCARPRAAHLALRLPPPQAAAGGGGASTQARTARVAACAAPASWLRRPSRAADALRAPTQGGGDAALSPEEAFCLAEFGPWVKDADGARRCLAFLRDREKVTMPAARSRQRNALQL
jgi:hypothetical protein